MAELSYDLLYQIILLLVQSPVGAADFARILSVCKYFLLFAKDKHILELVNFEIKMEFKNFYRYQHVNSLIVKCSEAGNVAARFLLGKVILVSSSQLLLSEWQKEECDFHPCDLAKLGEISCILATNVPAQEYKLGSFMTYFFPKQVSTSELSQTRLVHHQLVKLFLLNGSPYDFIEMVVFLKSYIKYYARFSGNDITLINLIGFLVLRARRVRAVEKLAKTKESFIDSYRSLSDFLKTPSKYCNSSNATSGKYFDHIADEVIFLLNLHKREGDTVGVSWRKAMNDVDYLQEKWNDKSNRLEEAYCNFNKIRAETLYLFDWFTQHVIQKM